MSQLQGGWLEEETVACCSRLWVAELWLPDALGTREMLVLRA